MKISVEKLTKMYCKSNRSRARFFAKIKKNKKFALEVLDYPEIASLADANGWIVAGTVVRYHESAALKVLDRLEVARLVNANGYIVVSTAVTCYESAAIKVLDFPEIACLITWYNITIASKAVSCYDSAALRVVKDPKKWKHIKNKDGSSVLSLAKARLNLK